jgi:hypothetical protein
MHVLPDIDNGDFILAYDAWRNEAETGTLILYSQIRVDFNSSNK